MKCAAACGFKIDSLGKDQNRKALTNSRSHRRAPWAGWSIERGGVEKIASLLDMGHKNKGKRTWRRCPAKPGKPPEQQAGDNRSHWGHSVTC